MQTRFYGSSQGPLRLGPASMGKLEAAAAPLAMLVVSGALVAAGVAQAKDVAPLQLPALQLPASLAAALGYPIPVESDDLVTLSTNLAALGPSSSMFPSLGKPLEF
ncbi:unnamed protein product [Effrenium voratum]|nr:unnamed protein product [Effrenium voratum]